MFRSVLVANRGEIAVRVLRTLRQLGVRGIAVHSGADAGAAHVDAADDAVALPGAAPGQAYLDMDAMLAAVRASGAEAVHPGYGFLSENAEFAQRVIDAGLTFIGPDPNCIAAMGDKLQARLRMAGAGLPVSAGSESALPDRSAAIAAAERLGYPVMLKAAAGGGGIGMALARDEQQLVSAFERTRSGAERAFGRGELYLERFIERARHIEVQIFGLADGQVVALGERDCSVQRRHQKLAEETPATALAERTRTALAAASISAGRAVGYRGAGTVEWLLDPATGQFVFLEMNTRLQVEHTVTELVTGLDLVAEQLRVAAGDRPGFDPRQPPAPCGHALQLRVCAEDPLTFLPSPGLIERWRQPAGEGIRVDAGYRAGDTVTRFYDPLLAKLCVWAEDRPAALRRAAAAVAEFRIEGPRTNLPFFAELLADPAFQHGGYDTGLVGRLRPIGRPA
ncbi:MAG TPA: biotin carboxylase N-terminal domain-containing protein [Jatrophihabitans sp.]|nr:biotin carboxylase N-terminal domain-containing protein [Jatrophihabitans sp.]